MPQTLAAQQPVNRRKIIAVEIVPGALVAVRRRRTVGQDKFHLVRERDDRLFEQVVIQFIEGRRERVSGSLGIGQDAE